MANQEQLEILKQGVEVWNKWRKENPETYVDLREAELAGAILSGVNLARAYLLKANFSQADLSGSNLAEAYLFMANLRNADLHGSDLNKITISKANLSNANLSYAYLFSADADGADLRGANLNFTYLRWARLADANLEGAILTNTTVESANLANVNLYGANLSGAYVAGSQLNKANLRKANLNGAHLRGVDFSEADLSEADMRGADFEGVTLVRTIVSGAKLSGSSIYGISVWDLIGEFAEQKELIITPNNTPVVTVDNIKVAQFIYLILNNEELRDTINTLTSKSVLILGRFALPERKAILDALRDKLREYDLLPIVFDFDRPTDKDFTETIKTLAGLSYFVIADVTNPKSSPLELQATVPDYQIPFVPIIQEGEKPFAMMMDLQKKYNWVLNTVSYDSSETLIKVLKPLIIDPAMKKRQELRIIKAQEPEIISAKKFLEKGKE